MIWNGHCDTSCAIDTYIGNKSPRTLARHVLITLSVYIVHHRVYKVSN